MPLFFRVLHVILLKKLNKISDIFQVMKSRLNIEKKFPAEHTLNDNESLARTTNKGELQVQI